MRSRPGWFFVGLMACSNVNSTPSPGSPPPEPTPVATPTPVTPEPTAPAPAPEPTPTTAPAAVTVQMTAATLADDCGSPPAPAKEKSAARSKMKQDRRCEQSSMQLSVVAAAGGAPSQIAVKKVELFDDKGARIAELTARTPSVWDQDGTYRPWDQRVAPGQDLSVTYALSEPPWSEVPDRRARGYVLKAVLSVDGGEQAVQSDVQVAAPTILPPGVKT